MTDTKQELNKITSEKLGKGCGIGCVSIFVIIIVMSIIGSFLPKSPESSANMAYIQCQDFVKQDLKSPTSAKFTLDDFTSRKESNDVYIINSYVDSQNSYGAIIRQNFICKIKLDNKDNGTLQELTFLQ